MMKINTKGWPKEIKKIFDDRDYLFIHQPFNWNGAPKVNWQNLSFMLEPKLLTEVCEDFSIDVFSVGDLIDLNETISQILERNPIKAEMDHSEYSGTLNVWFQRKPDQKEVDEYNYLVERYKEEKVIWDEYISTKAVLAADPSLSKELLALRKENELLRKALNKK